MLNEIKKMTKELSGRKGYIKRGVDKIMAQIDENLRDDSFFFQYVFPNNDHDTDKEISFIISHNYSFFCQHNTVSETPPEEWSAGTCRIKRENNLRMSILFITHAKDIFTDLKEKFKIDTEQDRTIKYKLELLFGKCK